MGAEAESGASSSAAGSSGAGALQVLKESAQSAASHADAVMIARCSILEPVGSKGGKYGAGAGAGAGAGNGTGPSTKGVGFFLRFLGGKGRVAVLQMMHSNASAYLLPGRRFGQTEGGSAGADGDGASLSKVHEVLDELVQLCSTTSETAPFPPDEDAFLVIIHKNAGSHTLLDGAIVAGMDASGQQIAAGEEVKEDASMVLQGHTRMAAPRMCDTPYHAPTSDLSARRLGSL